MIESWSLGLFFALLRRRGRRARRLLRATGLSLNVRAEDAQCFCTRRVEIHAGIGKNLRCDSFLLAKQSQQQVLSTYIAMSQLASLAHCELQDLLGAGCIW
jgi:hypothetical protein